MLELLNDFAFPVVVTIILLYDKLKTNGALMKAVNNNSKALREIDYILRDMRRDKRVFK